MLQATTLSKAYKKIKVLDDVSIVLKPGTISGLLGRNGAGKTTLFKILCGLVTPDSGKVSIRSDRRKPIGAIIEQVGLYTYLNAWQNLRVFAQVQRAPNDPKSLEHYLLRVGLPPERTDPVRNFSMGMKQRLGIAIALLNDPDFLILDEPFSGLDPIGVAALINLIRDFALQGIAILISSHLMTELYRCCDYLYIIDEGKIINQGETSALINTHVSTFTLSAEGIANAVEIKPYLITAAQNTATIKCDSATIPQLLKALLDKNYKVTACTPHITLDQLLKSSGP